MGEPGTDDFSESMRTGYGRAEPEVVDIKAIRLPCAHLVPRPGPLGGKITCPHDGRVWKVEPDAGGHAWSAQEVVNRPHRKVIDRPQA